MPELKDIINVVLAVIAGAGSGYFSPWFKYKIDMNVERTKIRRSLVSTWRISLLNPGSYGSPNSEMAGEGIKVHSGGKTNYTSQFIAADLVQRPDYSSLEPHLSPDFREYLGGLIKTNTLIIEVGGFNSRPTILAKLADEISRIERDWRLV